LLPFLPRNEEERSTMFRTIGPVWDGNEVWLVVAGASMFAAFPAWYATMFSGFYLALLLILVFLIVRVVSFEWRASDRAARLGLGGRRQRRPPDWCVAPEPALRRADQPSGIRRQRWDLSTCTRCSAGSPLCCSSTAHLPHPAHDRRAAHAAAGPASSRLPLSARGSYQTVAVAVDRVERLPPLCPRCSRSPHCSRRRLRRLGTAGPSSSAVSAFLVVATIFTSLSARHGRQQRLRQQLPSTTRPHYTRG
jgi:hypothetical protein